MVLEGLSNSLKNTLQKITKALFVDEKLINELVKDIQRALLQSDVNVKLVLELTKKIKDRALNEEVPKSVPKKEHLINIVYEELVNFLGKGEKLDYQAKIAERKEQKEKGKSRKSADFLDAENEKSFSSEKDKGPYKIMLVGLFGSGKTTTTGKLANYFKKRGIKTAVISTDTWRPAAADQLEQLANNLNIQVFIDKKEKDPVKLYKKFEKELEKYDLVIIDTAGRDALSDELIGELNAINSTVQPD